MTKLRTLARTKTMTKLAGISLIILMLIMSGVWILIIDRHEPDPDGTHKVEYNDYGWSDYDPIVWGRIRQ